MEKSENYYKRQEHMKQLKVPTFRQIEEELGQELGNVVIEQCPEVLKKELGTEPKLRGAGDTLWTSPSDLLEGLVILKPPFTNRYIKALLHEAILSIGMEIENKFKNEMEEKCKHALNEQEEMLVFLAEQERIKAVRDALTDRIKYYEEKFESFEKEFEIRLRKELELLTERLLEDNVRVLQTQREQMDDQWQDILSVEVEETTRALTLKFLDDLESQHFHLTRKFALEQKKFEAKNEATLELERVICKETLKQLKHNLECKNISNLVYILCMERRKCEQNQSETQKQYDAAVAKLSNKVEESETAITNLTNALKCAQEKILLKEQCLKEILKQFQKFVYFALKAAPKQGEFLLNIEKLLLYELAETVSNLGKSKGIPVFLPKRSPPIKKQPIPRGLNLPEDHSCLDEHDPPGNNTEELFSVIFNDKLYVREDFRNMITQGITMRPSNELWNKDVEELITMLKTSIEETTSEKKYTRRQSPLQLSTVTGNSSVTPATRVASIMVRSCHKDQKIPSANVDNIEFFIPDTASRPERGSRQSSVYFVDTKVSEHQPKISGNGMTALEAIQSYQQQMLSEVILRSEPFDANNISHVAEIRRNTSILLCAKDSLEHHRMSLRAGSIKNDMHLKEIARLQQHVLKNEEGNLHIHLRDSSENLQENPCPCPTVEKIKKINEEEVCGKKDVVEVKKSIANVISNHLIDEGLLKEGEIMRKPHVLQVKDVKQHKSITPRERRFSGLSMAQDSLDIIRSKTMLQKDLKENFIKALNEMPSTSLLSEERRTSPIHNICRIADKVPEMETTMESNLLTQITGETKSTSIKKSSFIFSPLPKVYHTGSITVTPDQTWRDDKHHYKGVQDTDKSSNKSTNHKTRERDNFTDKENIGNITGSDQGIEMRTTAFTVDRVHSLLAMFKEDPSLMRLFTACSR